MPPRDSLPNTPRLSVVIPAYNEEKEIGSCLASVRETFEGHEAYDRDDYEVIVTDNSSTDATAKIAREAGAQVVLEPKRQISRARNAGAAVARAPWVLFIDADSRLSPATLAELHKALESQDYAGGGCLVALDGAPWIGRRMVDKWNLISRLAGWAAGSFLFCRTDAFRAVGGFSTELYAAEEIDLSRKLKRWSKQHGLRWRILTRTRHHSSGRKFHLYGKRELAVLFLRLMRPWRLFRNRDHLDFFYDGRR